MISSPSIMFSKPKPTVSKEALLIKKLINPDAFDELKKSEVSTNAKEFGADQEEADQNLEKPKEKIADLPVLKGLTPNQDWSEINTAALEHLTDTSFNFRQLLNELKKAK